MIQAVFFDLDGVLTLESKGSTGTCASLCRAFPHLDCGTVLNCYKTHFGYLTTQEGSFADHLEDFGSCIGENISTDDMHAALTDVTPNAAMLELATSLRQEYTVGIITNNSSERIRLLENTMDLPRTFDPVIVSGDVRCAKADGTERIFAIALEIASCKPEEAVFIDNAQHNLGTPSAMGMHTCWHDDTKNDIASLKALLNRLHIAV